MWQDGHVVRVAFALILHVTLEVTFGSHNDGQIHSVRSLEVAVFERR